jgi:Trk K+ transport system NAD-binding subunit
MHLFSEAEFEEIPVLEPGTRRVIGAVREQDVLEVYHREMLQRDLAGGVGTRLSLAGRGRTVELGGGYVLAEVEAPARFIGHTLGELDVRARTGVQVLLIRAPARDGVRVPDAGDRIAAGDSLVVAGPSQAVAQLSYLNP